MRQNTYNYHGETNRWAGSEVFYSNTKDNLYKFNYL